MAIIAVLTLWLVAVATGCGRVAHYDSRLVRADSLMQDAPDSALALVQAVEPGSLTSEADSAYRRLLLTQGRYRCYVTATSDSDINRALAYYRRHDGEREKLTRALIYKGAVMEELGHPDSAMRYYKTAETTAAPDDYFNLGYVRIQMAALYSNYYLMDGKDIEKYEQALESLSHIDNPDNVHTCLNNLGCLYRETQPKKAEKMLLRAATIAREVDDTIKMINSNQALMVLYFYDGQYEKAHQILRQTLGFGDFEFGYQFDCCAANIYSRLGMTDSADYYLNQLQSDNALLEDPQCRLFIYESLSQRALARQDTVSHLRFKNEAQAIADSLKSNKEKLVLLSTESQYDKSIMARSVHQQSVIKRCLYVTIVIVLILAIGTWWWHYRRAHRYDNLIAELIQETSSQADTITQLRHNIDQLNIKDQEVKDFINSHFSLMKQVIEACYHMPKNTLSREIMRIIQFQDKNSGNWEKLYRYIDMNNNNIMTRTRQDYPDLEERDLLMIALTTIDYTCAQIAIILGYSNATSISTIRQRIAKKMGITGTLIEYTQSFKQDT